MEFRLGTDNSPYDQPGWQRLSASYQPGNLYGSMARAINGRDYDPDLDLKMGFNEFAAAVGRGVPFGDSAVRGPTHSDRMTREEIYESKARVAANTTPGYRMTRINEIMGRNPSLQTFAPLTPNSQNPISQWTGSAGAPPALPMPPPLPPSYHILQDLPPTASSAPMPQVPGLPPFQMMPGLDPMMAPRSAMNTPQMMNQAGGLMGQTFNGLSRNAGMEDSMMRSAFNDMNNPNGSLMEMAAGPLASMISPFVGPNWDRALENLGSISDRPGQRQARMWSMIGDADKRGMARGQFADNYSRYWDPASPTNQQRGVDNQLKYQQNYTNAMNAATGMYNAQSTRENNNRVNAREDRSQDFNEYKYDRNQDLSERQFAQNLRSYEDGLKRQGEQDKIQAAQAAQALKQNIFEQEMKAKKFDFEVAQFNQGLMNKYGTDDPKEIRKQAKDQYAANQDIARQKLQMDRQKQAQELLNNRLNALAKLGAGKKVIDKDGKEKIDSPINNSALRQYFIDLGVIPPGESERRNRSPLDLSTPKPVSLDARIRH